jgi:nicotinic acid mononucleotide adenylyltransferase
MIRCGPEAHPVVPEAPAVFVVTATTPDISSSALRRLVGDGGSLAGLVPDSVARYIAAHRLYV